jgi:hypothetical protein
MYWYLIGACYMYIYTFVAGNRLDYELRPNQSDLSEKSAHAKQTQRFSGYYTPDYRNTERYGAAWLAKVKSFMTTKYIQRLRNIGNLEAVSLALMRYGGTPVMTRDYFDFQGEIIALCVDIDA